jgi:hypothetical protein
VVRYYDKDEKKNVDVGNDFAFLVLDELGVIKGWHDASDSGITSNEVRDTTAEPFVVKSFKGGPLVQGFYRDIKDRVGNIGGQYCTNIYLAYKSATGALAIGSLQIKGAALGAWMEFRKAHRKDIIEKAVRIKGFTEGKKGKIVFRTPKFTIVDTTEDTNAQAVALDKELQEYLNGYFSKTTVARTDATEMHGEQLPEDTRDHTPPEPMPDELKPELEDDSEIPF